MLMRKLLLLPLLLLTACGGGQEVVDASITDEARLPVYCIRDAVILDESDPQSGVLLDMPGYPYGQTDKMQEIDRDTYNTLDVPVCASTDPRMELKPSGIAWADGRNTDLDGNPL